MKMTNIKAKINAFIENRLNLVFLLVFFFFIFFSLSFPPIRRGDGSEYIIKTESIIFDQDLKYEDKDLIRHLQRRIRTLDSPSGLALDHDKSSGSYLTRHSFYYSLFSIPFYLLFSIPKITFSYYGFAFFNAILSFLIFFMIYDFIKSKLKNNFDAAIITFSTYFFSSALGYIVWIHPETFLMFLVTGFLYSLNKKKYLISAIFIGLASGAQPPLILLTLLLGYDLIKRKNIKTLFTCFVIVSALFSPQYILNKIYFDNFFTIFGKNDVNLSNFSLNGLASTITDPGFGLIWFYPMILYFVVNIKVNLRNSIQFVVFLIILSIFTLTCTIYSHQIGFRYLNYLYPLFIFLDWKSNKINLKIIILIIFSIFATTGVNFNVIENTSSGNFMNFDQRTYLPYYLAKKITNYLEYPQLFNAHSEQISKNVNYPIRIENGFLDKDYWLINNHPGRILFYNLSTGTLKIQIYSPHVGDLGYYSINNGKRKIITSISRDHVIDIPINSDHIKSEIRTCYLTNNYLYLDLYFNKSSDQSGVQLKKILNNRNIIFSN